MRANPSLLLLLGARASPPASDPRIASAGVKAKPSLKTLAQAAAADKRTQPERLREDVPLARYGLDSMAMVELAGELEQRFGCRLEVENLPEAPPA